MNPIEKFENERNELIKSNGENESLKTSALDFLTRSADGNYSYNFMWMGRPIIQYPQDIVAMQELIWEVKPDLIIETGIAHGGSLIFSASMLALLELCGEIEKGEVLGIDIDIRAHNKEAIEAHPMSKKITMFQGSSIDNDMIKKVHDFAKRGKRILVCLDSNHTHEHVLAELKAYASLTSVGSYCVVFDTLIEDMPQGFYKDRSWNKGDNPKTAVWEFLKTNDDFLIDEQMDNKLLISVAPSGYLKRIH
jgi:cephalosporin hydroxylase